VVIVDDLIATGGTVAATVELLEKIEVEVVAAVFLIELATLRGRERLKVPVASLVTDD
jgi:adenine phosphoribosyltransferase